VIIKLEKIKILAIVGSLRKESYNRQLALAAKEILGDRVDFSILDYQDVPFMNEDIEFPTPEAVKRVREEVKLQMVFGSLPLSTITFSPGC